MNQISTPRRSWLALLFGTFVLTGSWVILHQWLLMSVPAQNMSATAMLSGPTISPVTATPSPPLEGGATLQATKLAYLTQEAQDRQFWLTQEVLQTPCRFCDFPIHDNYTPEPFPTPVGLPAGDGVLFVDGSGGMDSTFFPSEDKNVWYESFDDGALYVYAGLERHPGIIDKYQAAILVWGMRSGVSFREKYFPSLPQQRVSIVGAKGERLILVSTEGQTLYFDVPGRIFVNSLTDIVLTVTPALPIPQHQRAHPLSWMMPPIIFFTPVQAWRSIPH